MKILIVEDDQFKSKQITALVRESFPAASMAYARSVHSGKEEVRQGEVDFILLDMSLPAYDIGSNDPGGRPQAFGGRELLGYMDFLGLSIPTIVVTQFERFGVGEEEMDILTLGSILRTSFSDNFVDIIYYNVASEQWKHSLRRAFLSVNRVRLES
ncbi:response regulator [Corallococcus sp. AB018]|uniref:response regulator n=1 Tax=Corallococcus sp. AB018 TaxID=2316715 RepID=UPI000F89BDBE|nr:response regulator [Corallococcus sp. AB018]